MKTLQIACLIGFSTLLVACPGTHSLEQVKWDDPRILRGIYSGEYGTNTSEGFQKQGTIKFEFTPEYINGHQYALKGTLQMDQQQVMTLENGLVYGSDEENFVQPQHSMPMPARMFAKSTAGNKVFLLEMWGMGGPVQHGSLRIDPTPTTDQQQSVQYSFSVSRQK